jgi:predicted kinase
MSRIAIDRDIKKEQGVKAPSEIIFITGLPCTGKTFIGKHIANYFSLPYLFKDGIKETLFDSLGWSDRAWSKKVGTSAYSLLFYFAETLLVADVSFVLESNFSAERDGPKLLSLQDRYSFHAVEIQCMANGDVLVERYRKRWEAGHRHPGHVDPETYEELQQTLLQGRLQPLGLRGDYFEVNTTDFDKVDVAALIKILEK